MDWESKKTEDEKLILDIVRDTIKLDYRLSILIAFYFGRAKKLHEIIEKLLEKEFFSLANKAAVAQDIARKRLPPKESRGLQKKIHNCLEIRNALVHRRGKKDKWQVIGYEFGKNEKKKLRKNEELKEDYYKSLREIYRIITPLANELHRDLIVDDLSKCIAHAMEAERGWKIYELQLVDSVGIGTNIHLEGDSVIEVKDDLSTKEEIRRYLYKKYKNSELKRRIFDVSILKLEPPKEEYQEE